MIALVSSASICNVYALEIGFEGVLSYEMRQNTDDINPDDDALNADTEFGNGLVTVFGEHSSTNFVAGFNAEIETEKNLTDENNAGVITETRFAGAADIAITPRTLRWHFGDLLTGVRNEDTVRLADDLDQDSRNIFITGPSYQSSVEGFSSTEARLLYISQSEDNDEVESLYNFQASYQRNSTENSFYGIQFNDVFTSVPQDEDQFPALPADLNGDYNRASVTIFKNRARPTSQLYGEIGITQYDTDSDSVNGLTAQVRSTRFLGPRTLFTAGISHSLNDQALNTVEALIQGDGDDAGLQPDVDGIFEETRLDVIYSKDTPFAELEFGAAVSQLNYRLLTDATTENFVVEGEDRNLATINLIFNKTHSARLRGVYTAEYEKEDFTNRDDSTEAYLLGASLFYRLNRSFELLFSLEFDAAEGLTTRGNVDDPIQFQIDETESRAEIGIRWAPPTRASREAIVQLNSLVE